MRNSKGFWALATTYLKQNKTKQNSKALKRQMSSGIHLKAANSCRAVRRPLPTHPILSLHYDGHKVAPEENIVIYTPASERPPEET